MVKIYKYDLLVLLIFLFFFPFFFYNLGNYSLVDFDEAWFAEVARNISMAKNPLLLTFNHDRFIEHPPLGFILMALSFAVFGINEFAARFFSALSGWGSLVMLYLIGKRMFNRTTGLAAVMILVSCVWFVFRARSANLDTLFVFFYLTAFYCSLKLKHHPGCIYGLSASLAAVFLTKTLIGLSVLIPVVTIILIERISLPLQKIFKSILLFFCLIAPWLVTNYLDYGQEFINHLILVGLRPFGRITPNWSDIGHSLTFQYLHYGMRKWYYPVIISFLIGIFFIPKHKRLLSLYLLVVFLILNFLTNAKTEIWHLIPLYPFLAILIAFVGYQSLKLGLNLLTLTLPKLIRKSDLITITSIITLALIGISALYQAFSFRGEVKWFDHDVSGLAYTASAAKNHPEKLYLYADYFLPSAVFYSQKDVLMVKSLSFPKNTLVGIIDSGDKPFLLLGEKWKFDIDKIDPEKYQLLAQYKEYILVKVAVTL